MKHPVLVGCVVICILAITAYLLLGRFSSNENRIAEKFSSALNKNASDAIGICKNETPFKSGDRIYYAHSCLLEVACQIKKTSKKGAVEACRKMDDLLLLRGDQNITSETCIKYVDENC